VTWNVFQAWKQFQHDGDRAALQRQVAAIKMQMLPLLEWGSTGKRQRHVRALAKNLLKLWPALWTFADVPDVEPTNNAAERGLRAAVIYRKLSLGRLNTYAKAATCWAFAEPSDGLEPSTPSLPSSNETGTAGTRGKPRARNPRKPRGSAEHA
jgi:transposase